MADFTVGGDWTFSGASVFTGSFSASVTDFQVEGSVSVRLDTSSGGAGNVQIASSNATHLELGNTFCGIDLSGTTIGIAGSGQFSVGASAIQLSAASDGVFYADSGQVVAGSSTKPFLLRATTVTGNFTGAVQLLTTSGDMAIGTSGVGAGDLLISGSVRTFVEGTTVLEITCSGGDINEQVTGSHAINIKGELGASATLNLGVGDTVAINLGSAVTDFISSAATWDVNTTGTLHLGSGGTMTLGTGSSIEIDGPSVSLCGSANTNQVHIGNPLAGNILFIDTADVRIPNDLQFTTQHVDWQVQELWGISVLGAGGALALVSSGSMTLTAVDASGWNFNSDLTIQSAAGNILIAAMGTNDIQGVTSATLSSNLGPVTVLATTLLTLSGATVKMTGVATQTGTVSVPSHTPGAGFKYLVIDAAGNIEQFAP